MALGIGAKTAMFSVVDAVKTNPFPTMGSRPTRFLPDIVVFTGDHSSKKLRRPAKIFIHPIYLHRVTGGVWRSTPVPKAAGPLSTTPPTPVLLFPPSFFGPSAQQQVRDIGAPRLGIHVVEGSIDSEEFNLLRSWIDLSRAALISYWDGDIDTQEVLEALRKL